MTMIPAPLLNAESTLVIRQILYVLLASPSGDGEVRVHPDGLVMAHDLIPSA